MSNRSKLWIVSAFIYSIFVFWYTDFGGPLQHNEIEQWKQSMIDNGSSTERIAYFERFLREDSGRQFLMLNAIDLNDNPPNVNGAEPGEDSNSLMGRYLKHMMGELLSRACHPVIVGTAPFTTIDLVGIQSIASPNCCNNSSGHKSADHNGAESWDQGAFFRYRSRRDFMHIIANPATLDNHRYKLAALKKTIAYPIETSLYLGDLRLLLGLLILSLTALLDSLVFVRGK